MYMQQVRLLQMEPVQHTLAQISGGSAITTAAPDVHGDLPALECDLVSDNDDDDGREVESIPDETDYAGNLHDKFEMVLAVQEQQAEAEDDLVLNELNPVIIDGREASLWGEITSLPSPPSSLPSSPPSSPPSLLPNSLPLVPTLSIPPSQPSEEQHLKESTQPSIVLDKQCSATSPEPSHVSGCYRLMGEVITEFNCPTEWMQGTMIQVVGHALCQGTHLHLQHACHIDILPSNLLTIEQLKHSIEGDWLELKKHIRQCLQPNHCRMWLIKVNWISESVLILDSISTCGLGVKEVLTIAQKIVAKIHEVLKKSYVLWNSFSLDPVSPNVLRISPLLNDHNQRPPWQTNANDCGPHLAFDIACLAKSGQLKVLAESSVPIWRTLILKQIRQLPVYDPKQPRPSVRSDDIIDLT